MAEQQRTTHELAEELKAAQRKLAELQATLQERDQRFQALSENQSDLYAELDVAGRFLEASASWQELLGLDPAALMGTRLLDLVHPLDQGAAAESFRKLIESRLPAQGTLRIRHGDGSWRWLESRERFARGGGEKARVLVLYRDTTERRRAEQELRESEERYRRLVELAPFAIVVHVDGAIVYANPAAVGLFGGQELDLLVGRQMIDFVHPDSRGMAAATLLRIPTDARPPELVEGRLLRADGHPVDVEVVAAPVTYLGRAAIQVVAIDVTERRQAEEEHERLAAQVQHAQKLESLGRVAGGIAHDFNNLLTGILSNAGLALAELPWGSHARDHIQQIEMSAQRAAELAGLMLTYAGRARFVAEPVNLTQLVENLGPLLRASLGRRSSLRQKLDPELPWMDGDPTQLQQVVMNLVTNAAESLGDGPRVVGISTGVFEVDKTYLATTLFHEQFGAGPCVYLVVSDTGRGMDRATQARVFEPFFSTKPGGTGLGLATVLGIVRRHRGAIKVDSRPGEGTTIRVLFPLAEDRAVSPAFESEAQVREEPPLHGTVLVVDDDEGVRHAARLTLERAGARVLTAEDGRAGIALLRRRAGEIVAAVVDLEMPGLGGEETLREMQRLASGMPLILSSGYPEDEVLPRFTGVSLGGFLAKPYGPGALVQEVRKVLSAARKRREA